MLPRGTKLTENEVVHNVETGVTTIIAIHKGQPMEILVDTADWPLVEPYSWHVERAKKTYYAKTLTGMWSTKNKRGLRIHRLLCPTAEQVDHIDRNGLNNRRSNLRPATNQENNMNRGKKEGTSSSLIGVSWDKARNKWQSGIKIDGKRISLGRYTTAEEAGRARDCKALELFKDRAVLNFPNEYVQNEDGTWKWVGPNKD